MGLAHRIIPTLLCKGRSLVKGQAFEPWRGVGLAVQGVRINAQREVDELVLLDVTATREGRTIDPDLVSDITDILYSPIAVGGGIRTVDQVRQLLRAGADKVVLGTAAASGHREYWRGWPGEGSFLADLADIVGRQAIVVSIDVRAGKVWNRCGSEETGWEPALFAKYVADEGAGEILLTSIEREGTLRGYDLDLIRSVRAAVRIPLIVHGGCGTYEHMREALEAGASAVAAGAMFQFTDQTPNGAARYLASKGIEVRL